MFNTINEFFVIKGKEKLVGAWLATVSASIFAIVVIGGHTRLTKSGLSMVRWEPHRILPPMNQEEWEKEFEEYKKSLGDKLGEVRSIHKNISPITKMYLQTDRIKKLLE